jgi:hypothetical protein
MHELMEATSQKFVDRVSSLKSLCMTEDKDIARESVLQLLNVTWRLQLICFLCYDHLPMEELYFFILQLDFSLKIVYYTKIGLESREYCLGIRHANHVASSIRKRWH